MPSHFVLLTYKRTLIYKKDCDSVQEAIEESKMLRNNVVAKNDVEITITNDPEIPNQMTSFNREVNPFIV